MELESFSWKTGDGRTLEGLKTGSIKTGSIKSGRKTTGTDVTICLHGWLDNANTFTNLMPKLPGVLGQIIAIDLPGHGLSDHLPPGGFYIVAAFALDVAELITCCFKDQTVTLLGHSLGAAVASTVAGILGDRVSRLILLDGLAPMSAPASETVALMRGALGKRVKAESSPRFFKSLEEAAMRRASMNIGGQMLVEDAMLLAERGAVEEPGKGWKWRTDNRLLWPSVVRFSDESVKATLSEIKCEVLIVFAADGLYKQLLLKFGLLGLSAVGSFLLWLAGIVVGGKTGAAMKMGSEVGRRVRCIEKRKVVLVAKGGHHVHLGKEGSEVVAGVIEEWCCGKVKFS